MRLFLFWHVGSSYQPPCSDKRPPDVSAALCLPLRSPSYFCYLFSCISARDEIRTDTRFFRAESGIYPSTDPLSPPDVSSDPQIVPDFNPAWDAAWEKARALIADFAVEDKVKHVSFSFQIVKKLVLSADLFVLQVNVSTGVGWMNGRCVGNTPPVPFDGSGTWQGLCLEVRSPIIFIRPHD